MRWHIYGTDAATTHPVELTLDEPDAAAAIKVALDRQILVDHIRAAGPRRWAFAPWAGMALVVLGAAAFFWHTTDLEGRLARATAEQNRMAASVAQAEHLAADLRDHGNLAAADASQLRKLSDELTQAKSRMNFTEQQLTAAQKQMDDLQRAAERLPTLESERSALQSELAATQKRVTQTAGQLADARAEVVLLRRHMDQADHATDDTAKIRDLERLNKQLAEETEKLKTELLITAPLAIASPRPRDPDPAAGAAVEAPVAGGRWALRTPYQAASEFLIVHVDRGSLSTAPAAEGLSTTTGLLSENAAKLRMLHDVGKERVYQVTLTLSLAADAPREIRTQNVQLATDFLHAFAPAYSTPDTLLSTAAATLLTTPSPAQTTRLLFLADDTKITAWTTAAGLLTLRIDSAHTEAD